MLFIIYFILLLFIGIYFIFKLIKNPTWGLIPYNLFIETTQENKVFYNDTEKHKIFPGCKKLQKHWKAIQKEAINVMSVSVTNVGKNFITESDEFWAGWKTFPLRMFGKDHTENLNKCPLIKSIIDEDDDILTAFFSIMEPHKTLSSHYGPFKGILRYHLGLLIPPKDAGNCFISVDNEIYEWKEGEGILFDETYKHFVMNETDYPRIILFIDIRRPFENSLMKMLNESIIWVIGNSPYNNS